HDPEAGVQEVADASGVGRTTVYRHFPDRESLLEAVIAEILDRSRRELEAAVADSDPEVAIRGLSATSVDLALRFGRLFASRDGASVAYEAFKSDESSPARRFLASARERSRIRTDMPVAWMRSVIQAVTFTAIEEIGEGALTEDAAIRLAGDTLVSILLPR
ncbi:MAG: TetR/AcrR family transcriptional regulator, partial [Bauldia sp.]